MLIDALVNKKNCHLMADASLHEWHFFLKPDMLCHRVYHVDPILKTKEHADASVIGWPILWLLGSHHKKHIFVPQRLPSMRGPIRATDDMIANIKWKFLHESGLIDSEPASELAPPRDRRARTRPCGSDKIPSELNLWCRGLRHRVLEHCSEAFNIARSSKDVWWSNS